MNSNLIASNLAKDPSRNNETSGLEQSSLTHFVAEQKQDEHKDLESTEGNFRYRLGIIDFLTEYGTKKKMEKTFNNMLSWGDKQAASCQDPATYADRFIRFLNERL
jgi:hypothetical protein